MHKFKLLPAILEKCINKKQNPKGNQPSNRCLQIYLTDLICEIHVSLNVVDVLSCQAKTKQTSTI